MTTARRSRWPTVIRTIAAKTHAIVAYVAFCLFPSHAATIAWVFAGMVLITVGQRLRLAVVTLR